MVTEDFKLQLYFNMYKDYPIGSRDKFRTRFVKKHGNFHYLPELILMIEKYQKEKFGMTIWEEMSYNSSKKRKGRR